MRIDRRLLYAGAFFIALGGVMLAAQVDGVDDAVVGQVLRLWPLVLIALGIALVLRRTRFSLAGGMLAAAVPGMVLGGALAIGPRFAIDCGVGEPGALAHHEGTFAGPAHVTVRLRCGELALTTVEGSAWQLDAGNSAGQAPRLTSSADGLALATGRSDWFGLGRGRDSWRLALPTGTPVDATVEVNAGESRIDLAGARLGDLAVTANAADARADLSGAFIEHLSANVNAGSFRLQLPDGDDLAGSVSVNAGSLKLCAPGDLGLRNPQHRHPGIRQPVRPLAGRRRVAERRLRGGDAPRRPDRQCQSRELRAQSCRRLSVNRRRLYRCRHDQRLAGVASGLAEYLDVDPSLVRVLWVLSVFVGGLGILAYIVMAFIVPVEPAFVPPVGPWQPGDSRWGTPAAGASGAAGEGGSGSEGGEATADAGAAGTAEGGTWPGHDPSARAGWPSHTWNAPVADPGRRGTGFGAAFFGLLLIAFGAISLVDQLLPDWADHGRFVWPVFLLASGGLLVVAALRRRSHEA